MWHRVLTRMRIHFVMRVLWHVSTISLATRTVQQWPTAYQLCNTFPTPSTPYLRAVSPENWLILDLVLLPRIHCRACLIRSDFKLFVFLLTCLKSCILDDSKKSHCVGGFHLVVYDVASLGNLFPTFRMNGMRSSSRVYRSENFFSCWIPRPGVLTSCPRAACGPTNVFVQPPNKFWILCV